MLKLTRSSLVLLSLTAVLPAVYQGEAAAGRCDCCCRVCQNPCGRCCCPSGCSRAGAVQQAVVQQRDVLMTEYRNEPVTETVPSTIYENVMVDEGSYQTVWVPRLTTRSVARTVYQTRTSYRTVPYQVTRRISEYGTQTLPYQTVRHYPVTTPGAVYGALPYSYSAPSTIAASSIVPGPSVPVVSSTNSIAPTPIVPRTASADERFGGVPSGSNGPSLFAPAPSAAQAWRSAARNSAIR